MDSVNVALIAPDGTIFRLAGDQGMTLMECAKRADIPGIVAECGGACVCATCHVLVDERWKASVGLPSDTEAEMLDFAAGRQAQSRLSCQIRLSPALDGLVVHIPATQG